MQTKTEETGRDTGRQWGQERKSVFHLFNFDHSLLPKQCFLFVFMDLPQ